MLNELGISRGQAARYVLLPEILPRLGRLFKTGFISLPYFIIVVFNTLKIIPDDHIYLRRESHGQYSIWQALGVSANHITFNWKNADKVVVFTLVLAGIIMMGLQLILLLIALFTLPAYAYNGPGLGPRTFEAFLDNAHPDEDLAFRLLDLIFGIPDIYYSKDMGMTPFHEGLHALFEFYSFGMLIVGTIIIVYLVMAIVMETAQSGVPFGQRFNKAWAPIRIILFFGLLLPAPPYGISVGQYILLNAARLGSNVATNAWIMFETTSQSPYLGDPDQLIATPNVPDLRGFVNYMALVTTCQHAEARVNGREIQPYFVYGPGAANATSLAGGTPAFTTMVNNVKGGTMLFRFGVQDEDLYPDEPGAVYPYCGEMSMPVVDQSQPGAALIQQAYVEAIGCLWDGRSGAALNCNHPGFQNEGRDYSHRYSRILPFDPYPNMEPYVDDTAQIQSYINLHSAMSEAIDRAVEEQINNGDWTNRGILNNTITDYGWAGAAIWFNKIAEQNGALTTAIFSAPEVRTMPDVMEFIKREKMKENSAVPVDEMFMPVLQSGKTIIFETPKQKEVALILNQQYRFLSSGNAASFFAGVPESSNLDTTGNVIIDTVNAIMGTHGLFDLCKNTDIHPLAQLSSLGKGLVEHSIRAFGVAAGLGIGAGLLAILKKNTYAQSLSAATGFFVNIASIGLILGFILFYVLPFMPFIYFFFALMTWVKSIFEAMVGVPLWALSHLRIDGEGMPGDAAESGYFFILEIFLRPICILIAFLGSIIIFGSLVKVLNQIFYLVVTNLSGHDTTNSAGTCFNPPGGANPDGATEEIYKRGSVDEFFYSVIYAIVVYMIGTSCFKLVDLIPDRIMRWLGVGINTFGNTDGDPAANMVKFIAGGAGLTGRQLKDGVKGFGFLN